MKAKEHVLKQCSRWKSEKIKMKKQNKIKYKNNCKT